MKRKNGALNLVLLSCSILIVILIALWYGTLWYNQAAVHRNYDTAVKQGNLVITNLNVGKADSCVIQLQGLTGIIDTGTEDQYETICSFLCEQGISSIDFMILTHYDKDHIGSAKKLIEKYEIGKIIAANYVSGKQYYSGLKKCLDTMDNVDYIDTYADYQFDELQISVIPTSSEEEVLLNPDSYDNNMSLVVVMNYGANRFLFAGDIEQLRIEQMLREGYDLGADWIKMPHHGKYDDSQMRLLRVVKPAFAVISTSKEQAPEAEEIALLQEAGIEYFITSGGNTITQSNGTDIQIFQ